MRTFLFSYLTAAIALVAAYVWAGGHGLVICALMIMLEVSFSFDNAVVNAVVLKDMSHLWQRRFLTWGMLVTVFGMYYLFPLLIVSVATGLGLGDVMKLAIDSPEEYSHHLSASHIQIATFGGMFLLMVFLKFILDEHKTRHWLGRLEANLAKLGKLEAVETIAALTILLLLQMFLPQNERAHALASGVFGVVLYVGINSLIGLFGLEGKDAAYSGLAGFMYLNLLDASFSLDAVIGSFAISNDIVIIVLGLSAGAMFVRSMTVHLVRTGTLEKYIFLEHGAHYAIGALAVIMLASLLAPVSEFITGTVGIGFILLSLASSVKHNRKCLPDRGK